MYTAAPERCHLLRLSKVADTALPTAEQHPRTGMQRGICVPWPRQIPAWHISTGPSSAVCELSSWRAGVLIPFCWPFPGAGNILSCGVTVTRDVTACGFPALLRAVLFHKHFWISTLESTLTRAMGVHGQNSN